MLEFRTVQFLYYMTINTAQPEIETVAAALDYQHQMSCTLPCLGSTSALAVAVIKSPQQASVFAVRILQAA